MKQCLFKKYTMKKYNVLYWLLQIEVVSCYVYSVINILWEHKYGQLHCQAVNKLLEMHSE